MKIFFVLSIIIFINHCSFDTRTGIWKNESYSSKKKENKVFEDFKKISISEQLFNKTIAFTGDLVSTIPVPMINNQWQDVFYNSNNNSKNFKYNNSNKIAFKSQKLTNAKIDNYKLFIDGNLIVSDKKGNIILYSLDNEKIILKFNFYKKKFKRIKKNLNLLVEKNIIYVADNLGYVYALNYKKNKVIWAKNYKIPFNSNIKIFKEKIFVSNQNNNLFILNKTDGSLIKSIPTEEFVIKNKFTNNLSYNDNEELFYLNSFGSLYSINLKSNEVNWFNNFNQSTNLTTSDLFEGSIIVNSDKIVIISSNDNTYLIDSNSGSVIKRLNFSTKIKPIIMNNFIFFISKNNYLISLNLNTNEFLYSYNIGALIEVSEKTVNNLSLNSFMILNNEIFIFFDNSQVANIDINGKFKKLFKLPSKINSFPISIDSGILYLNNKNKLVFLL